MGAENVNLYLQIQHITSGNCCANIFSYFLIMVILIGLICLIIMENHGLSEPEVRIDELIETEYKHHFKNTSLFKLNIPRTSEDLEYNKVDKDAVLQKIADLPSNHNNVSTLEIQPKSESLDYCALDERDFIKAELKRAEEQFKNFNFEISLQIYENLALKYPDSPGALKGKINAFTFMATISGSPDIIKPLIAGGLQYLALDDLLSDEEFKTMSYFCIKRMQLIDDHDSAFDIYLQLIKRFDDDLSIRIELAEAYIDSRRISDAKDLLEETLKRWPNNGTTLTYYGYVAHFDKNWEQTVHYMRLGLNIDEYKTRNCEFYSVLGTALLLLNRTHEARKVFRKSVALKLFVSEYQRPVLYIKELKAQPIWIKEETPYIDLYDLLESNWRRIRDEGLSILNKNGYFTNEIESLTNFGLWQEFYFFDHGNKKLENCKTAEFTCGLFQSFIRHICYSCQVLFSIMHPRTHIKPHCGPHNARLRAHLGLMVPNDTKIRIVDDERSWEEGKLLIFDDSFEHEVWNNGNGIRFVLIIDLWHPQVTDDHKTIIKSFGWV